MTGPARWVERCAQRILDEPAQTDAALRDLENQLEQHYEVLLRRRPEEGEFVIATWLRSAAWSAISHLVYDRLIGLILPVVEGGGSLVAATDIAAPLLADGLATGPYGSYQVEQRSGACDRFLRTVIYWQHRATQETIKQWRRGPEDPQHQLWLALNSVQRRLHLVRLAYQLGGRPDPEGYECWVQETIPESTEAALELLLLGGVITTHHGLREPLTVQRLTAYTSAKIDALSWLATVKRSLFKRHVFTDERLARTFEAHENGTLKASEEFFADRVSWDDVEAALPLCAWQASGLREQPWERHGACVGVAVLRSPDPASREQALRFFGAFKRRYPLLRAIWGDDGGFDRITVLLLLSLLVAEETVYAAWPQLATD